MNRAEELAVKEYPYKRWYDSELPYPSTYDENSEKREGFIKGYEQAVKDMKDAFEEMSKNTNSAIDAVKVLGSLLDNPVIKKLGKSKPIPKKSVKTNPFFGGEKK